ncbi:hypothetical protein [Chitinophaga sp. YR627]|uniref:hypothetical protein n=1 Tax=Chitinophaga sp. YR627 TaxID=1881041 RepID=UPI001160BCEC|nr:hypothetical protein [Chitinophaga sp. YR627]
MPIPLIRTNYNFLFYLREGSFLQQIDNEEYHVKTNSVVFVSAGTASSLKKVSKRTKGYFIPFTKRSRIFSLIALVSVHSQMVISIVIYCLSPLGIFNFSGAMTKNTTTRLIGLEHPLAMITAIVLITIGYSKSKRATDVRVKFKHIAIFYSIALALILLRIPWS